MTTTSEAELTSGGSPQLKWLDRWPHLWRLGAAPSAMATTPTSRCFTRVLALVAVAAVAALVALQTTQGRAFWVLAKEARMEIRKVVWPTPQERLQTTLVVLVLVFVVALDPLGS